MNHGVIGTNRKLNNSRRSERLPGSSVSHSNIVNRYFVNTLQVAVTAVDIKT